MHYRQVNIKILIVRGIRERIFLHHFFLSIMVYIVLNLEFYLTFILYHDSIVVFIKNIQVASTKYK